MTRESKILEQRQEIEKQRKTTPSHIEFSDEANILNEFHLNSFLRWDAINWWYSEKEIGLREDAILKHWACYNSFPDIDW